MDSAEIQGIELGTKYDLAKRLGYDFKLEPYLYWTHLLVFEDGNGFKLPDRARDSLSTGLSFASGPLGLTANLDVTYYGTQYGVDRVSGSSEVEANEKLEDVGDAWVVDINMSQRLYSFGKNGDLRVKGSVRNLFDELYANNEDSWMPGRSFYVGLE